MNTAGVVLCGGKSSRYGAQKIFETYEGSFLYERSLQAFTSEGLPSYLLTNAELSVHFREPEDRILVEGQSYQGPLYALQSAMTLLPASGAVFLLPADVPRVHAAFTARMMKHASSILTQKDALIPVSQDRIHPVHGVYHRRVLPCTEQLLAEGEQSMRALLNRIDPFYLSFSEGDPAFININRFTDWSRLQE
ncbi:molybdenum cofactor guanylyltransferase [Salibacterium halotolerans]|uniref:Probable molybdenum cofactor guanylyltransferase n=1 Tax=Salibacterium halotolerans TaxID=1884432 RepID=A0A1I5QFN6_9BACI|nr:molybdenum cofactor guanylyltransferase [Salibacterium halotolerans]SFP45075.1 molybdopterin-guanine dinucleotide biosynthesis protein A [Salibacterium halotolerans]